MTRPLIYGVLVVSLLLMHSSDAPACGPYPRETLFSYETYPTLEVDRYAAGELGVIQPTYWRRFLFVAYRYLSGAPLTEAEQAAFRGDRQEAARPADSETLWREARASIPGTPPLAARISRDRRVPGSEWQWVTNCHDDAFATAADTLRRRATEFGTNSDGVRRWVAAQDQVFSNCSEGTATPPSAEADLPALLAADRRYQIAAAHFYALHLDEATRDFTAIATDRTSPWSDVAAYLVARCLLRQATLDPREGYLDRGLATRAVAQLEDILDDPSRQSVHPAAARLLQHALAKTAPVRRLTEVANALSTPGTPDFDQNLVDFQLLMDRADPGTRDARAGSDLVDWVMAFQAGDFEHALARFRATQSHAWLVAALVYAPLNHPAAPGVRTAAADVPSDASAWATLTYHRIAQTMAMGQLERARDELDSILSETGRHPGAVRNRFLSQRFALSRTLGEALRFAPRHPVAEGIGMGDLYAGPLPDDAPTLLFAGDSVRMFNQGLPLRMLLEASTDDRLPTHLRAQLTLTTWVRATLLERWDTAWELAESLRGFFPSLGSDLDVWRAAATDEERRFLAAYLVLRHPRMKPHLLSGLAMKTNLEGIDPLRDNWWCSFSNPADLDTEGFWRRSPAEGRPSVAPASFLTEEARIELALEWSALQRLETAPNHLAATVTAYAATHRDDMRSPEALHLAVRATRFGCTDADTADRSRAAFQLLHDAWPTSEWAQRTPYWFR